MILEAFADYLRSADPVVPAESVLLRWLWEKLTLPAQNNVDRVLRSEITVERSCEKKIEDNQSDSPTKTKFKFSPRSSSGRRLLKSLYEYSMSYEQQKWSRWVHRIKASDFNYLSKKD